MMPANGHKRIFDENQMDTMEMDLPPPFTNHLESNGQEPGERSSGSIGQIQENDTVSIRSEIISLEEFRWNLLLLVLNRFPTGLDLNKLESEYCKVAEIWIKPDMFLKGGSGWKDVFEKTYLNKFFIVKRHLKEIIGATNYYIVPKVSRSDDEFLEIWESSNFKRISSNRTTMKNLIKLSGFKPKYPHIYGNYEIDPDLLNQTQILRLAQLDRYDVNHKEPRSNHGTRVVSRISDSVENCSNSNTNTSSEEKVLQNNSSMTENKDKMKRSRESVQDQTQINVSPSSPSRKSIKKAKKILNEAEVEVDSLAQSETNNTLSSGSRDSMKNKRPIKSTYTDNSANISTSTTLQPLKHVPSTPPSSSTSSIASKKKRNIKNDDSPDNSNDSSLVNEKNFLGDSYKQENAQLIQKFHEIRRGSTEQFTTLECRSIRIGLYKVLSTSSKKGRLRILFSPSGIYFKVSHALNGDIIECAIPITEVLHCYGHLKHRMPVLFIYIGMKFEHFLENKLGIMTNERQPQPPCVAVEIDQPDEMDKGIIRKVFGVMYSDIEYIKANKILATIAAKNMEVIGNNNKKESSLTAKSSTVVSRNYPKTRSQKNLQANLDTVTDLNKIESSLLLPIPKGITITTRDIECLNENNFLNDNIIDFYLHHLYQNILTPEQQEKCFIFPTQFFDLLNRKRNDSDKILNNSRSSAERKHARVDFISQNIDIFAKDFLFVPICENSHWYLAVICFPGLKCPHDLETNEELPDFKYLDKKAQAKYPKKIKQPLILVFDSYYGNRGRIITILREYLQMEYNIKKSDGFSIDKYVMSGHMPLAPQQTNDIDDGLFILEYFRYFYQDPITDYKVSIFSFEKKRWFHPTLPSNLRKVIFDTLDPLLEENILSNLPQLKFPAYVDPAKVKFVIKAKKKGLKLN